MRPPGDAGFSKIRQRSEEWSALLLEVDDGGPLDLGVFRRLLQICREHKVAIWHGHDYKSNLIGLWLRRYWPMKLVTTVHGWVKFTWRTPLYYAIDRFCLRWYDRVICVSDDLHMACLQAGVRPERCTWIENAIDTRQFLRSMTVCDAKRKLGFDPERQLVGAVGRLSAEKGFDVLIRALAELRNAGREIDLVIVGDGDQQQELESLIRGLKLEQHVRLLGFRADTVDLFQAFDAFALSSYREGLPNVVLEAMALETPVVATAVAGVPKLITDGVDGLLVQPGDVAALSQSLGQVCADSGLAHRLAAAGRATIERRFSFHRRMARVASVYDELLKGPDRPVPCI
jgi:glycosyltransferase involved in cell wall biosynthesis